jgi:hypothetical protein
LETSGAPHPASGLISGPVGQRTPSGDAGLLVSGAHHQPHHLAMAKGEFAHAH